MCDQLSEDPVTGAGCTGLAEGAETDHTPAAALMRRQGIPPIRSADDLIQAGMFDTDDELEEFLTDLYASRRTDTW